MIYRHCVEYAGMTPASASLSKAPDAKKVSSWDKAGVEFCFAHGIMRGDGHGRIDPSGKAQRSHLAKMITVTHRDVIG